MSESPKEHTDLTIDPTKVYSWHYRMAATALFLLEWGGANRLRVPDGPLDRSHQLDMNTWECGTSCCVAGYSSLLFRPYPESKDLVKRMLSDGNFSDWHTAYLWPAEEFCQPLSDQLPCPDFSPKRKLHNLCQRPLFWYMADSGYPDDVVAAAQRILVVLRQPEAVVFPDGILRPRTNLSTDAMLVGSFHGYTRRGYRTGRRHQEAMDWMGIPSDVESLRRAFVEEIEKVAPK